MNWDNIINSPIPYLLFSLILIILLITVFRKQLGGFISRLTRADIELDKSKGAKVSLQASKVMPQTDDKHNDGTSNNLFGNEISTPILPSSQLSKSYSQFIGRINELEILLNAIRDSSKKVIAIYGLGGIGKTALTQEAITQVEQEHIFEQVIWLSGKAEVFEAEKIEKISSTKLSFDKILEEIARACGRTDIEKVKSSKEKKSVIAQILSARSLLIVLDNLETFADPERIVSELHNLIGKSRLLITSRHQLLHEGVYGIDLTGLTKEDSISFLRKESLSRGITTLLEAPKSILNRVYEITGGAPLAMKLVAGQMARRPIAAVVDDLLAAKFKGPDYPLYQFVFKHSWDLLDNDAKRVLVSMSTFAPNVGGNEEAVLAVSSVSTADFHKAMDSLILMSLVDIIRSTRSQRYSLHPLTHYFVLSDIVKKWG